MQITTTEMPPVPNEDALILFDMLSGAIQKNVKTYTEKQFGKLDGMTFGRANLVERLATGADVEGILYVGRDEATVIAMRFFDAPSHAQESKKLGAAALLTFRKKQ